MVMPMPPVKEKLRPPVPVLPRPQRWGIALLFIVIPMAVGMGLGAVAGLIAPRIPSLVIGALLGASIGFRTVFRVLMYGALSSTIVHSTHRE
jgi:hypothetical protein